MPLAVKMKTMKYFSFTVFSFISLASCNGLGPQAPGLLDEAGIRSGGRRECKCLHSLSGIRRIIKYSLK